MKNVLSPYKVLDSVSNPIAVLSPIYAENSLITDFIVAYANSAYDKLPGNFMKQGILFSEICLRLPNNIDWFTIAVKTIETGKNYSDNYLSTKTDFWFHVSLDRSDDNLLFISITDITAVKQQEAELHYLTYNDRLTELPNRQYFNQIIDGEIANSLRLGKSLGLMLIDIDNMKEINSISGLAAGDDVLRKSSRILTGFNRSNIKPFRIGDDEYVVVMTEINSRDELANKVDAVFDAFQLQEISISAGVSLCPEDNTLTTNLLKFADLALRAVKKNGKNDLLFFSENLYNDFIHQTTLQRKVISAVENGSFILYYQPQFNIQTNMLRGFEALLRWYDESLGWISPETFIPVAERTHAIMKLGYWVLETAIATMKDWQQKYNFDGIMSVNVSPVQLEQKDFIVQLQLLIEKYQIDPSKLEIEITEGIFIDKLDETILILNQIRELGVLLSLDDFGTGYSSFRYLQHLPITTLKIDKSFVSNLTENAKLESNITESIIALVNKMGLDTIAEGVENTEQLEMLRSMNCVNIQGFLRGQPMNIDHCNAVLGGDKTALVRIGAEPLADIHILKSEIQSKTAISA